MQWEKLPIVEGRSSACACCGFKPTQACMGMMIAVGFGDANVTKNGEVVYSESRTDEGEYWLVEDAENAAMLDPDNDWRIRLRGPLSDWEYQRQGPKEWLLVHRGNGFA